MAAIGIILASVREGRRGEPFARWLVELTSAHAGLEPELVDLRDWPLPSYSYAVRGMEAERHYPEGSLQARWAALIRKFDGFVIVSPEYNRGYPGQLKNALDSLYQAWNYKPVAFVTYGGFAAGSRAAEQLAQVARELKLVALRDEVNLSLVGLGVDERGFPTGELHGRKARALLGELAFWVELLKTGRERLPH